MSEHLVEDADRLAVDILRLGLPYHMAADLAADSRYDAGAQRPLHSQNRMMRVSLGGVLGTVHKRLIEQQILAAVPSVRLAIDEDAAFAGRLRRHQAQMTVSAITNGFAI